MLRYSSEEWEDMKLEYKLDRMKEGCICPHYDRGYCKIGGDYCISDNVNPKKCDIFLDNEE